MLVKIPYLPHLCRFNNCTNECELDGLMLKFQRDAVQGIWSKEGWPSCGYTVSKMAINAYTRWGHSIAEYVYKVTPPTCLHI